MKICTKHLDLIKNKLCDVGLEEYVPKSIEESKRKFDDFVAKGEVNTLENFDALFYAHSNIVANAIRISGIFIIRAPDTVCPICSVRADDWIDKVAVDAVNMLNSIRNKTRK